MLLVCVLMWGRAWSIDTLGLKGTRPDQIKVNQTKSNQIRLTQTNPD
jgi:hypothetical protein